MTDDKDHYDAAASYDAFPYESFPFAVTHPDRLHVLGRLCGLEPAPVETCRVLELGCAAGGNLIPLAADLPGGRFLGVDASPRQVEDGKKVIAAAGLENVELRVADILQLDPAALGTFDHVVCHGVYSWVPHPVQEKILSLARACLAPQGVAYVSYNVLPGWRMRGMIRDMCRWHARQFDDPKVQVEQARRLLDFLFRRTSHETTAYSYVLRQELDVLRRCTDAYLFHEHLETVNEPLYLHQFVDRAAAAGLRYVGEASLGETEATLFPELGDEGRGEPAMVQAEQYRDFVRNRLFRTSILCHRERTLTARPKPEDVVGFHVAAVAEPWTPSPEAPPPDQRGPSLDPKAETPAADEKPVIERRTRHGKVVRTTVPLVVAALDALDAAWPQAVPFEELLARARLAAPGGEAAADRALLAEVVLRGFAEDVLELRPRRLRVADWLSARPRCGPAARAQLALGLDVTNQRHESIRLDRLERQVLALADGTRDAAAIVDGVVRAALEGTIGVKKDGQEVTDPAALRELLEEPVRAALPRLHRASLFVE